MLEELQLLVRLQQIDNQLIELEAEKGDLPEQISTLSAELNRHSTSKSQAETTLEAIVAQKKQLELTIESSRERLKKSQTTIYSVKTTREYDAISIEIEQAKQAIAEADKQIADLNAKAIETQKTLETTLGKISLVSEEFEEKQADMREHLESSEDVELKLNHERDKVVVRLKKPVLAHYERIRKIREGIGVSHLHDGACSYCCSRVPPQRQTEIKRMDDIILCEVCGCVLVAQEG